MHFKKGISNVKVVDDSIVLSTMTRVASHIHIHSSPILIGSDIEVAEQMGTFSLPNRFEIECTEYYQHLTPDSVHRKNVMWNA